MLRVLIREEQQICVTKVCVSSFYVILLSPQLSSTVLIKLFLDSCFPRNFRIYQNLYQRSLHLHSCQMQKTFMSVTWGNISREVSSKHVKHKITKTKKPNQTKKIIICASKKKETSEQDTTRKVQLCD